MTEKAQKLTKRKTKKSLHKMSRGNVIRHARSTRRILKYGTINFGRNIWLSLASTLVMTITLIIVSLTAVASVILTETANSMREKIDITIFLKPATSAETLAELETLMKENDNINEVSVSDSNAEYEKILEENSDNPELLETLNDMKDIMLATTLSAMRIKVKDLDNLDSIKNLVEENELFVANLSEEKEPTYDENRAEIETITSWANIAKNGGIILGVVFLVISILMIFNTIRMAIFSRREEIYMMKLVGADRRFIRGPFLVEAGICGLVSGALASVICFFGLKNLSPNLADFGINVSTITSILDSNLLVIVCTILILLGVFIGVFSARLATKRYLRKTAK